MQRRLHPIPARVRFAVLKRSRARCENCGEVGRLELHHRTYYRHDGLYATWPVFSRPPLIFGHETAHDLLALCGSPATSPSTGGGDGAFYWDPEEAEASHYHEDWN